MLNLRKDIQKFFYSPFHGVILRAKQNVVQYCPALFYLDIEIGQGNQIIPNPNEESNQGIKQNVVKEDEKKCQK